MARTAAPGYERAAWTKAAPVAGAEPPMITALKAEHRHMAAIMALMSDQLDAIERGELAETHVLYETMHYMVSWPDQFHHPREDLIYGLGAELNGEAADNVDSLQREHDEMAKRGRELLGIIQDWRDGTASGATVVKNGRDYIQQTYRHMNSEEQLVFPQIAAVLSPADWRELAASDQLRPMGDPVFGPRVQREFRNMARKLRRGERRRVERGAMTEWIGIDALLESVNVVSMAADSSRSLTGEHARRAWDESMSILKEKPLTAPWRCALNNTRISLDLMGELAGVS